jgi:tRNA 5-methylaminomethyl-2-thiouridine biosynthesis bifunctional protein
MCQALAKEITLIQEDVATLRFEDGFWIINGNYRAKRVVLATGAYRSVLSEDYLNIRGVWGHRIDIQTSTINKTILHQFVSISTSENKQLSIGATHNVHYHPQTTTEPYDIAKGREELLEKAKKTLDLKDVTILKDYTGLRSGSSDYMPIIGKVVASNESMQLPRRTLEMKNLDFTLLSYYPNLYMINGSSGYGFVFAPYLAKQLSEHIVAEKEISCELLPARFFARWARRNRR